MLPIRRRWSPRTVVRRLPQDTRDRLQAHLDRTGRTFGQWVREVVTDRLDRQGDVDRAYREGFLAGARAAYPAAIFSTVAEREAFDLSTSTVPLISSTSSSRGWRPTFTGNW